MPVGDGGAWGGSIGAQTSVRRSSDYLDRVAPDPPAPMVERFHASSGSTKCQSYRRDVRGNIPFTSIVSSLRANGSLPTAPRLNPGNAPHLRPPPRVALVLKGIQASHQAHPRTPSDHHGYGLCLVRLASCQGFCPPLVGAPKDRAGATLLQHLLFSYLGVYCWGICLSR